MNPFRITIDTNPDQCNLKCIMCDTHSIYNKDFKPTRQPMSKHLLEKCLNEAIASGVQEIIPTTMGEPLLYKEFNLFIEKISQSNAKLNLTTNGTFPKLGVRKWADKLLPVLSDIKISINAIDSKINETIMIGDHTVKKLENIKTFAKLRDQYYPKVTITLQVTFLKTNLEEMEHIIQFGIEHNLNRVKGHQLWVTFEKNRCESLASDPMETDKWNHFVQRMDKYREQIMLTNFTPIEPAKDTTMPSVPRSHNCPFLGKELWIDNEGNFNICCAPSKKRTTLGDWGNIATTRITEVFQSDNYKQLLQTYKDKDICKMCALRRAND